MHWALWGPRGDGAGGDKACVEAISKQDHLGLRGLVLSMRSGKDSGKVAMKLPSSCGGLEDRNRCTWGREQGPHPAGVGQARVQAQAHFRQRLGPPGVLLPPEVTAPPVHSLGAEQKPLNHVVIQIPVELNPKPTETPRKRRSRSSSEQTPGAGLPAFARGSVHMHLSLIHI